jgi:hypothetical protein
MSARRAQTAGGRCAAPCGGSDLCPPPPCFCPCLHAPLPAQVFKPAAYPAAAILVASPLMPLAWNAWAASFLFLVCMSQQFHAWSHMKKSELSPAVVLLQVRGAEGRAQRGGTPA